MKSLLDERKMKDLFDRMKERVPALRETRDDWVRRMMKWHFSDETGSVFWLKRKAETGFDPVKNVQCYDDIKKFGLFDKKLLNGVPSSDLVPRGFQNRERYIRETGGTTGEALKIIDVTTNITNVAIYGAMLEARGLFGGNVVGMTPSGPHAYGNFVRTLVDQWHGFAFFIDFDPRWVKKLIINGKSTEEYIDHLVDQTMSIVNAQKPSLMFTTSKLVQELAVRLPKSLAEYGIKGVCTGGTSCSKEEIRYLSDNFLKGVQWIDTYGNTLMGHALQGDPWEGCTDRSYYLPPPLSFMEVVDPEDWRKRVAIGEGGRVMLVTLLEDLFLPNLLERDCVTRVGPHPWFPWDGVKDVKPFVENTDGSVIEGVY